MNPASKDDRAALRERCRREAQTGDLLQIEDQRVMKFYAVIEPAEIIALLDRVEELERDRERVAYLEKEGDKLAGQVQRCLKRIEELEADLARADDVLGKIAQEDDIDDIRQMIRRSEL